MKMLLIAAGAAAALALAACGGEEAETEGVNAALLDGEPGTSELNAAMGGGTAAGSPDAGFEGNGAGVDANAAADHDRGAPHGGAMHGGGANAAMDRDGGMHSGSANAAMHHSGGPPLPPDD